jgi:hypothetical protein
MSVHHSLAAVLWLLTALGAYEVAAYWADDAQAGKLQPWVLVILFWAAAAVSAGIHYLSHTLAQLPDALRRYWLQRRPALNAYAAALGRLHVHLQQLQLPHWPLK